LNESVGPSEKKAGVRKVESSAKMGSSEPIVEISAKQEKSTMMLHEDSSATETNDGMSTMGMLDGNTRDKDGGGLFKFKKVKGFK
jgi:hypothetical protein